MSVRIITRSAPFYAGVLLVLATIALFVFEHNAVPKKTERLSDKMFLSGDHTPGRDVMSAPLVSTDNTNPNTRPTVNSTAAASSNESQKAPMLVNLVGGLEAKVAADPGNIGNQILLAQTYAEVGRIPDGVGLLRKLLKTNGDNNRIPVVLASLLLKSDKQADIKEALAVLDDMGNKGIGNKGVIHFYQGEALLKIGKKELALKKWSQALNEISETDGLRKQVEQEIALYK